MSGSKIIDAQPVTYRLLVRTPVLTLDVWHSVLGLGSVQHPSVNEYRI